MRAVFSGNINIGILNLPIQLGKLIDNKTNNYFHYIKNGKIPKQVYLDDERNEISRSEMDYYFELGKEKVLFTKEEKETLKLPNENEIKVISVMNISELNSINPFLLKNNEVYQAIPDKDKKKNPIGLKPYNLILKALGRLSKVLIGKTIMYGKEKYLAIFPDLKDNVFICQVINYAEEIRAIEGVSEVSVSDEELNLAEQVLSNISNSEFKLTDLKDKYKEMLESLVERKVNGEKIEVISKPVEVKEDNFMESLKVMASSVNNSKEVIKGVKN